MGVLFFLDDVDALTYFLRDGGGLSSVEGQELLRIS
jgi:hypothetical protein